MGSWRSALLGGQRSCHALEMDNRRSPGLTPAERAVRGHRAQSLAWPDLTTPARVESTLEVGGERRATHGPPPAQSHLSSALRQLRMWTIYTSAAAVAGETSSWSPYVGMASSMQAARGQGPGPMHLSWLSFSLTKSPLTFLPVTGSRAAASAPPCCVKIRRVPVPLVPELSPAHWTHSGAHTYSDPSIVTGGGPRTPNHQVLWVHTPLDGDKPATFPSALVQCGLLPLFSL